MDAPCAVLLAEEHPHEDARELGFPEFTRYVRSLDSKLASATLLAEEHA